MMPKILKAACVAAAALMVPTPAAFAGNAAESGETGTTLQLPKDANCSLLLKNDDKVVYKGVLGSSPAGAGTAQMLYPAPNAAGLLAAMITHGLIIESVKNSQKEKQIEAANQVLLPYQAVLNDYRQMELLHRGLEKTSSVFSRKPVSSAEDGGSAWLFESTPVFSLTQDQRAIILDNNVAIYAPGARSTAALQYTIRVVSQPKDEENLLDFWTNNQGQKLKDESAGLFAQSLDLVLDEAMNGPNRNAGTYRTVRYREGSSEKMERAQVLNELCDRVVIRTLRGWLMSVPAQQNASIAMAAGRCDSASLPPR